MHPWRCHRCATGCAFLKDLEITDPPMANLSLTVAPHPFLLSFPRLKKFISLHLMSHRPITTLFTLHWIFQVFFPRYLPGEGLDIYHEIPKSQNCLGQITWVTIQLGDTKLWGICCLKQLNANRNIGIHCVASSTGIAKQKIYWSGQKVFHHDRLRIAIKYLYSDSSA